MKTIYYVKDGEKWVRCWKAVEIKRGFLHYEMRDGTNAFARPGTWKKEEK